MIVYLLFAALDEHIELRGHFAAQVTTQVSVGAIGVDHMTICGYKTEKKHTQLNIYNLS